MTIKILKNTALLLLALSVYSNVNATINCSPSSTEDECLQCACYQESQLSGNYGSSEERQKAKVAISKVILSRVQSKKFPNTICEVVFQKKQFGMVKPEKIVLKSPEDENLFKECKRATATAKREGANGIHYYLHPTASPRDRRWTQKLKSCGRLSNYYFFSETSCAVKLVGSDADKAYDSKKPVDDKTNSTAE